MKPLVRQIKKNTHPGEYLLEDIIKIHNLTIEKTANLLGISRPNLSNIVNCKSAISPLMAIRISKVFGGNPDIWMKLQYAYDLRKAEKEFSEMNIQLEKFEIA